jgi:hypothetical protein
MNSISNEEFPGPYTQEKEILEFCFFNCQITVCGLKKINVKRKKSDVLDAKHAKSIQHIDSS